MIELRLTDFLDFKSFSQHRNRNRTRTKDAEGETVHWQKIKWLLYTKEDTKHIQLKYKLSDQAFTMLVVGKQETRCSQGPVINKKDLLTLCMNGSTPQSLVDLNCQGLKVMF